MKNLVREMRVGQRLFQAELGEALNDCGALFDGHPDERQAAVDLRATAIAGVGLAVFCVGAAIVSLRAAVPGIRGPPWTPSSP